MIHTGPDEPNLRVVDVLDTENDDPEMHFTVLVVEEAYDGWRDRPLRRLSSEMLLVARKEHGLRKLPARKQRR